MNSNDNGFLGFNQHRIPREHMLMKNSKVCFATTITGETVVGSFLFMLFRILTPLINPII